MTGSQPELGESEVRGRLSSRRHRHPSGKGFPNGIWGSSDSSVGVRPLTGLEVGRSSGRAVIRPRGRMEHQELLRTADGAVPTVTSVAQRVARSGCSEK